MKKYKPTKQNPGFGIITPTAYLEQYAIQSNFHLVLAHLVDKNDIYANFYAKVSERGDYIICDNGAFELGESYDPDKLIDLAYKCKADAIVLPDYPAQHSSKTIQAAIELGPKVKDAGFDTFFCPQSEMGDWEGWQEAYEWVSLNDEIDIIGISILALPNALPHIPAAYARVVGTQILISKDIFNFDKYHHYLGLNAGPGLEIPPLIKMNALDSCDSSAPVWFGINGIRYNITTDSLSPISKQYMREVDFSYPWNSKNCIHEAIQYNIDRTLELFDT